MDQLNIELPEEIHNLAGGEAYRVSVHYELVSLLLTSFVQDQYYRTSQHTIDQLKKVAMQADPDFAAKAAIFARKQFGMRSITHWFAAIMAPRLSGKPWARHFYQKIIHRPDDMVKTLEYYYQMNPKAKLPNALKKGFATAFDRFDSYQIAKYKNAGKSVSLMDVVRLVHPKSTPKNEQGLKLLVEGTLANTQTWESMLSAAGKETSPEARKVAKATAWKNLLQNNKLGYFALLRNLRNVFYQAPESLSLVCEQLTDKQRIKNSLVLPFRLDTAYQALGNLAPQKPEKPYYYSYNRQAPNVPFSYLFKQLQRILLKPFLKDMPAAQLRKLLEKMQEVSQNIVDEQLSNKEAQDVAHIKAVATQILSLKGSLNRFLHNQLLDLTSQDSNTLYNEFYKLQTQLQAIFRNAPVLGLKKYQQVLTQWEQTCVTLLTLLEKGIGIVSFASKLIAQLKAKTNDLDSKEPTSFDVVIENVEGFLENHTAPYPQYKIAIGAQALAFLNQRKEIFAQAYLDYGSYDRKLEKEINAGYQQALTRYIFDQRRWEASGYHHKLTQLKGALKRAIEISMDNVPAFEGHTLIALDVSGSMAGRPFQIGSLFMAALAHANPLADLMIFDSQADYLEFERENILQIRESIPFRGWGTDFKPIFNKANKAYRRIIILSDMQAWENYWAPIQAFKNYCTRFQCHPYIYSLDLAGYGSLQFPESRVCAMAGFSENIFDIMSVIETDNQALIHAIEQQEI
ncbi:hypothetical protein BKI52_03665 [marine bacterium AO1-C]|nr:hypothetical protein BKI52_03665 [marine bacterium AO1-C]